MPASYYDSLSADRRTPEIIREAEDCLAAHTGTNLGDLVWNIHHRVELEPLVEPAGARIEYILAHKDLAEVLPRLRWMRPVVRPENLPHPVQAAASEYYLAMQAWYKNVGNDHHVWNEARTHSRLRAQLRQFSEEVFTQHYLELPGTPWDPEHGSLFPTFYRLL